MPDAQTFLLRAEAELDTDYARCLADANAALELDPRFGGGPGDAVARLSSGRRSECGPASGRGGRGDRAAGSRVAPDPGENAGPIVRLRPCQATVQEVLAGSSSDALAQAGAHLLLGDTLALLDGQRLCGGGQGASGSDPAGKSLIDDPHARRRRKACELLIDAHLHVAYSIAWGHFQHKSEAVQKWLEGAAALAGDLVAPASSAARGEIARQRAGAGRLGRTGPSAGRGEVGKRGDRASQSPDRRNDRSDSSRPDPMAAWPGAVRCGADRADAAELRPRARDGPVGIRAISSTPTQRAASCQITIFCLASSSIAWE